MKWSWTGNELTFCKPSNFEPICVESRTFEIWEHLWQFVHIACAVRARVLTTCVPIKSTQFIVTQLVAIRWAQDWESMCLSALLNPNNIGNAQSAPWLRRPRHRGCNLPDNQRQRSIILSSLSDDILTLQLFHPSLKPISTFLQAASAYKTPTDASHWRPSQRYMVEARKGNGLKSLENLRAPKRNDCTERANHFAQDETRMISSSRGSQLKPGLQHYCRHQKRLQLLQMHAERFWWWRSESR